MSNAGAMAKLRALIVQAEDWRAFHKKRGPAGYIEALAASIRLKALKDAYRALQDGQAE